MIFKKIQQFFLD